MALAGDIGGTKTNMGLFSMGGDRPILNVFESYSSRQEVNLEEIIQKFISKHTDSVSSACFGIAGPVYHGRCKMTNLSWDVSEERIKNRFKWTHVSLINDLEATAYAIPILNSKDVLSLNGARLRKGKNIALIAPGTGLGEALLIFHKGNYFPVPSEGGHADFAPGSEFEAELWQCLRKRFGHVSVERVLSGSGLLNIYSWLKCYEKHMEPSWLTREIKKNDPAMVISKAALSGKDWLCLKALNVFVSILGAVSGNLALTGMTTGGVYLGGGIPPKILPVLEKGRFMESFISKGRFRAVLEKIPVRVILNDKAALLGAAQQAIKMLDMK